MIVDAETVGSDVTLQMSMNEGARMIAREGDTLPLTAMAERASEDNRHKASVKSNLHRQRAPVKTVKRRPFLERTTLELTVFQVPIMHERRSTKTRGEKWRPLRELTKRHSCLPGRDSWQGRRENYQHQLENRICTQPYISNFKLMNAQINNVYVIFISHLAGTKCFNPVHEYGFEVT